MRVLHITRDLPPRGNGGISSAVGGLLRAQRAAGDSVAAVSFDDYRARAVTAKPLERDQLEGASVLRVHSSAQLQTAFEAAVAMQSEVIVVHHDLLWDFGHSLAQRLGAATVLSVHVLQREQDRLRRLSQPTQSSLAQDRAVAQADLVSAPSRFCAERLTASYASAWKRLRIAPLGVSLAVQERREAVGDAPRIAYVGRFADVCGIEELLELLPILAAALPTAVIRIAGGLPANPRAERRWRARFDALDARARDRCELLGWLEPAAVTRLYAESDILLSPSRLETFGLVVREAMAQGVAVIATRSGGVEEAITSGVDSLLCEAPELAAVAIALAREPARARSLGIAAAARARSSFGWEHVLAAHRAIYRESLGSRTSSPTAAAE